MQSKVCNECGVRKSIECFWHGKGYAGGRMTKCSECLSRRKFGDRVRKYTPCFICGEKTWSASGACTSCTRVEVRTMAPFGSKNPEEERAEHLRLTQDAYQNCVCSVVQRVRLRRALGLLGRQAKDFRSETA